MPEQPNIILMVGEDSGRHLGCYGDRTAVTPNLDRFASEGCRYDNAYSTAPVCAPSRCTMVTGRYPQSIGTHLMRSKLLDPPRLFTQELRDAGYHVNWHTKLDFNFDPDEAFADRGGWRDAHDDWRPKLAAGDLPDQPWLCYVNFGISHESGMWPVDDIEEGRPKGARFNFTAGDPLGVPAVHDPAEVEVPPYLPDTPAVRKNIAQHADNVTEVDRQVGEVLDALDKSGQRDRTIVIFMVDHGRGLPREKRWCYRAGLHLPLIVRWPGQVEPGGVSDRLVSWIDLAPTLLSLTGTPIPESYEGRVFMGPDAAPEPSAVFAGRDRMDEAFDVQRAARDHRYHYTRNFFPQLPFAQRGWYMEYMPAMKELRRLAAAGELTGAAAAWMAETKPAEELFDVATDPHCVHNLADDPAHAQGKAKLSAELDQWMASTGDLGMVPERELIARGLIADQLDAYRTRLAPLPPEQQLGLAQTVLEQHEAEALASKS